MQPIANERFSRGALTLRDLVFVVRKDQINAAGVNVERLPQVLHAHRRALDVPAGPSRAQRRFPGLLPGFARLPESEVSGIVLAVFIDIDPRARLQAADIEVGQRPIARKARDPIVGRAVRNVGVPIFGEPFDQRHHLEDVPRSARVMLGPFDPQRIEILEKRVDVLLGELVDRLSTLGRLLDDAILDIGEVHHLRDLVPLLAQDPAKQVLKQKGAEVADVGIVVNRRAARVHPDVSRLERHELFDLAAHRVVQAKWGHGSSLRSTTAWAARASPRPMAPMWSVVVALRPTAAGSTSRAAARLLRIS